ncbi:MAG: hypothetical protein M3452_11770, partial [Chloroflexota bacterium]|nr:hypothetical protein [Chloroflexota bacterium]
EAYRTMPNHIFRGTVLTHLRTATAHPLDNAMFAAIFSQWEGEDGQARYMRNLERFDERYTEEFEPLSAGPVTTSGAYSGRIGGRCRQPSPHDAPHIFAARLAASRPTLPVGVKARLRASPTMADPVLGRRQVALGWPSAA